VMRRDERNFSSSTAGCGKGKSIVQKERYQDGTACKLHTVLVRGLSLCIDQ